MPTGIPNKKKEIIKDNTPIIGTSMTKEELDLAEQRMAGKVSPLASVALPKTTAEVDMGFGRKMKLVGNFSPTAKVGHSSTLERFKDLSAPRKGWIEMTAEQADKYQKLGILVGHNPLDAEGLLSDDLSEELLQEVELIQREG